ncbi:hypothetical protein ZIOFF_068529 [Zingiber officinale]|uniref:Uncharacterized protein n=1 Tax=Zingiber officinale TaxID=94328 RepID=A0A8J5CH31_ZINOF|nr:hypothetical protein ZIOFF_068529 [Zingiber officinale]
MVRVSGGGRQPSSFALAGAGANRRLLLSSTSCPPASTTAPPLGGRASQEERSESYSIAAAFDHKTSHTVNVKSNRAASTCFLLKSFGCPTLPSLWHKDSMAFIRLTIRKEEAANLLPSSSPVSEPAAGCSYPPSPALRPPLHHRH